MTFVKVHESDRNRCETFAVLEKRLDNTKARHYSYVRDFGQSVELEEQRNRNAQ